jgi:hypothetical protein
MDMTIGAEKFWIPGATGKLLLSGAALLYIIRARGDSYPGFLLQTSL